MARVYYMSMNTRETQLYSVTSEDYVIKVFGDIACPLASQALSFRMIAWDSAQDESE